MISTDQLRGRRAAPVDRSSDRRVALGSIVLALAFLVAAVASAALPEATRVGLWLPLHLALAGAASTAVAGVMPFFAAAFAAAPPIDGRLRWAAVWAVAAGAAGVSAGVAGRRTEAAVIGGAVFVVGVGLTALATLRPLSRGLGPSRGIVTQGYVAALAMVAVGAGLATLLLAGWPPLTERSAAVRAAHGWLNLVGFLSVTIGTTLLHFFPTVIGARIAVRPSARLTVLGLAGGAPLVALAYLAGTDLLAWGGAALTAAGAAGLVAYAMQTWRTRARWTTDPGWHRFAMGGLVSAIAWFAVGAAIAVGRLAAFGANPAGWAIAPLLGPLVAGWVGLALLASATHLLPAIGPGGPAEHARQRSLLGRLATLRLVTLNAGVAAIAAGLPLDAAPWPAIGLALLALGGGATVALLLAAAWIGTRRAPPAGSRVAAGP